LAIKLRKKKLRSSNDILSTVTFNLHKFIEFISEGHCSNSIYIEINLDTSVNLSVGKINTSKKNQKRLIGK
jgi:hypothetical protein